MKAPVGYAEIVNTFGDVVSFVDDTGNLKPEWQEQYLTHVSIPYPLTLAWNMSVKVSEILCHKLLAEVFQQTFRDLCFRNMQDKVSTYGGCFNFRKQRTGDKLSTHAWGIAIDLNPATNQQGTNGDMDSDVVTIFRAAGFNWGGDFIGRARDPMHFQFCSGY